MMPSIEWEITDRFPRAMETHDFGGSLFAARAFIFADGARPPFYQFPRNGSMESAEILLLFPEELTKQTNKYNIIE